MVSTKTLSTSPRQPSSAELISNRRAKASDLLSLITDRGGELELIELDYVGRLTTQAFGMLRQISRIRDRLSLLSGLDIELKARFDKVVVTVLKGRKTVHRIEMVRTVHDLSKAAPTEIINSSKFSFENNVFQVNVARRSVILTNVTESDIGMKNLHPVGSPRNSEDDRFHLVEQFSELANAGDITPALLTALLDEIATVCTESQALMDAFESHALGRKASWADAVALEIAHTVTDRWEDRKAKHPGEPWIKNPSKFVAHVYRRWIDDGTLKQVHLKHDPALYQRYAEHISVRPQDDLGLAKSPAGRPTTRTPS